MSSSQLLIGRTVWCIYRKTKFAYIMFGIPFNDLYGVTFLCPIEPLHFVPATTERRESERGGEREVGMIEGCGYLFTSNPACCKPRYHARALFKVTVMCLRHSVRVDQRKTFFREREREREREHTPSMSSISMPLSSRNDPSS